MHLDWSADRDAGVTLVRCRLRNDAAVPRRARLRSLLDGPVLPPRRLGVPEPGWDAEGVEVRLAPGETRAVGFASPAPLRDPPVELVDVERADDAGNATAPTAADAVRDLGAYRPPRAVVDRGDGDAVAPGRTAHVAADRDMNTEDRDDDADSDVNARGRDVNAGGRDVDPDGRGGGGREPVGPARVDGWLDAVERRVERGERLTDADVATATEALAAAGGVGAVADLDERLAADAERLRRVSRRAAALAERAEATDVPTEALERLS